MPNSLDTYILHMQRHPGNYCLWYPKSWKFFACGIRNLGNFLPVESGILGLRILNTAVEVRHLTYNWNLESKSTEKV